MAYAEKRGKGEYPWRVKYQKPDGTEGSASGFRTRQDALDYGRDQEAAVRRGTYHDPKRGDITLDRYFWTKWLLVQRIGDKTRVNREGEYREHLAPRWAEVAIRDIDPFDVQAFEKELRARRAKSTADNVMDLLRFMMDDAVFAGLLKTSPVQPKQRRGSKAPDTARVGVVTTLEHIQAIRTRLEAGRRSDGPDDRVHRDALGRGLRDPPVVPDPGRGRGREAGGRVLTSSTRTSARSTSSTPNGGSVHRRGTRAAPWSCRRSWPSCSPRTWTPSRPSRTCCSRTPTVSRTTGRRSATGGGGGLRRLAGARTHPRPGGAVRGTGDPHRAAGSGPEAHAQDVAGRGPHRTGGPG